ncbi:MAG: MazG nucleotide pyrophosphohydrolase domain-containing protein [archaeon]
MMDFEELKKFVEMENKRLREKYGNYGDEEKRILARAVKLSEEIGELCSEILSMNSFQRKEKLDLHNKESLSNEFADVIITTLLLAKSTDVDIEKSLENKIEKINQRYKK